MRHRILLSLLAFATACAARGAETAASAAAAPVLDRQVTPLLEKYCYDCHGNGHHKGDVALDSYKTVADVEADRATWETVLHHVRSHEMPPDDAELLPTEAERDVVGNWIEKELYKYDPAHPDPGRVTIRRLNRAEYNNTIRDLVGVDYNPAADFPPDDSGYGFDNIGDVLSLPPVLMEKYLAAGDRILNQAIVTDPIESRVQRFPASLAQVGFNAIGDRGDGWVQLISLEEDDVAVELPVLAGGDYLVRVQAFAKPTGGAMVGGGNNNVETSDGPPEPTKISIMLNDAFIKDFPLSTDESHPGIYEARVGIPAGKQRVRAVVRRIHGGDNDLFMLNGRIGKQQPGIVFVKWIEVEGPLAAAVRRYPAAALEATGDAKATEQGGRFLEHNGEVVTTIHVAKEGDYLLRAQAYADQAGKEPTRMEFRIDGKAVKDFDVIAMGHMQPLSTQRVFSPTLLVPQPYVYEYRAHLMPGDQRFSAAFVNDLEDPKNENPNLRDRNLVIQDLEVSDLSAPVLTPPMPAPLQALFTKYAPPPRKTGLRGLFAHHVDPAVAEAAAARGMLTEFTRRAWRRTVQPAEIDRLMSLYDLAAKNGDSFPARVKLAMKAVLVSPHFLFLGEPPPSVAPATGVRPIDEFTLASRLSYFLWSSMPDDELLDLAARGQLRPQLDAQVHRMLASPKAHALVDNFAGQWLQFRMLDTVQPDKTMFPDFDVALRDDMQMETELFFNNVLREDRPVLDFLTGDYTFVNARLAKFYGLPDVAGDDFQKVSLEGTPRRGVLTQGSVLTLTSNPTRTSPVKRGKWVLENLLGTPPPPPPPNVPALDGNRKLVGTLRQQMEQHRADPNCASCHARMDPIGFSLENFDAVGAWRSKDGDAPIDASGKLTTGDTFKGATELETLLASKRKDEFLHCLAEKMLTYGLGRGVEFYDRPAVDQIVKAMNSDHDRFSSLILGTVKSFPFEMVRGETAPGAVTGPAEDAPPSGAKSASASSSSPASALAAVAP